MGAHSQEPGSYARRDPHRVARRRTVPESVQERRMSSIADVAHVAVTGESQRGTFRSLLARSWLLRAALVFAASTAMGLIFMFPMWSEGMGAKQDLAQWWAWGLLVPLIVAIDQRLPYTARQLGRRAAAHGLASIFVTALYVYV